MQERAYQHAAKRTGYMAGAIHGVFDTATPMNFFELVSPAPYSIYQERGTWKMAAHPFMGPALARNAAGHGGAAARQAGRQHRTRDGGARWRP